MADGSGPKTSVYAKVCTYAKTGTQSKTLFLAKKLCENRRYRCHSVDSLFLLLYVSRNEVTFEDF